MRNSYFQFKQFTICQDRCAMKVTTDSCLFGAFIAEELKKQSIKSKNLLDIGSGTGLLPLIIVQKNENIKIESIEIDEESFRQATENVAASPWQENIKVHHGNANTFAFNKKYNIIISNPPFYENQLQSPDTAKNKAHHSSELTLKQLFERTNNLLTDEGIFFFLLPYKRNEEAEQLLAQSHLFIHEKILVKQSGQHNYFRVIMKGGKQRPQSVSEKDMSICTTPPHYTPAFITLLKDYYLHL